MNKTNFVFLLVIITTLTGCENNNSTSVSAAQTNYTTTEFTANNLTTSEKKSIESLRKIISDYNINNSIISDQELLEFSKTNTLYDDKVYGLLRFLIDNKGLNEEKISIKYLANNSLTVVHSQLSEYTQVTLEELYKEPSLYLNKKITLRFLNSGLTTKMNDSYISVVNDLNRNSYLNLNVKDNTIVGQSKLDKNGWIYVSGTFTNYSLTNTIGTFQVYMDSIIEISLERP